MKALNKRKNKIVFEEYSQTFRLLPYNYWLASIKEGKLVFNSWDGMTKEYFKKDRLLKLKVWIKFMLKTYSN